MVLLGHIEILAKIYAELLVPQTVLDELQDGSSGGFGVVARERYQETYGAPLIGGLTLRASHSGTLLQKTKIQIKASLYA
jgi:hypothetical protein